MPDQQFPTKTDNSQRNPISCRRVVIADSDRDRLAKRFALLLAFGFQSELEIAVDRLFARLQRQLDDGGGQAVCWAAESQDGVRRRH